MNVAGEESERIDKMERDKIRSQAQRSERKVEALIILLFTVVAIIVSILLVARNFSPIDPTVDHKVPFETDPVETQTDEEGNKIDSPADNSEKYIRKPGVYNFLLIGYDKSAGLTDVTMLAQFDTNTGAINIIQIPRDTYARYNFADDLACKTVTVEYDIKYTVTDNKLNTGNVLGFTHGWTNRGENQGRYYLGMSAALSSDKTQVEFSRGYNQDGTASSSFVGSAPVNSWISIKHVFDFEEKTYDIYIGSTKAVDNWKMDTDIREATLVGIIPYGYTDNFNVYSGNAGAFLAEAPAQRVALPRNGQTTKADLDLQLTVNGTNYPDAITAWELQSPYSGVYVNGNVLTVTDEATSGTVYLVAKDGNIDVTKEVTLFEPTILLDTENTDLKLTAKPNRAYNIYIYKNKGGNDLIDSFITPTFYGDLTADVTEVLNVNTNSAGLYTHSLSSLDAGVYNIYAMQNDSDAEVAHIKYISKLKNLFDDESQISNSKFVTFLTNHGVSNDTATQAQSIYKSLDSKDSVYTLLNNDVTMFPIAASLCKVLDQSSDNPEIISFLADELKSKAYDETALDLLAKNAVYSEVAQATKADGITDVQTVLDNLKTNAILIGIKNVANKRDAKAFLAHIGSAKFDSATAEQKNTIADAVAKKSYSSISDVKLAVDRVNISTVQSGGGSGPSNISTGGGSASGMVVPPPVTKPTVPAGLYTDVANDFWAKDSIEILSKKKIVSGYNGMFRPNDFLSRGEMAKIICLVAGLEKGTADFDDVNENEWFYPFVGAAFEAEFINGFDGKFNPYENITRQDVAVILYRLFGDKLEASDSVTFADKDAVADYAKNAIAALCGAGIINGYEDGTFKPQSSITRAEIAHLLANCITLWEGDSNE